MTTRLEHANITVRDIDAAISFIRTALPDFAIRRDITEDDGSRWVHIGNNDFYLALNQASDEPAEAWQPYGGKPGVNHLGFEVEDAAAVHARLQAAGYSESTYPNNHPYRRRVYFNDTEGNDWEFVQYLSDRVGERNDYELPDQ